MLTEIEDTLDFQGIENMRDALEFVQTPIRVAPQQERSSRRLASFLDAAADTCLSEAWL